MIIDIDDIRSTLEQVIEYLCNIAKTQEEHKEILAMSETIILRDRLVYSSNLLIDVQKQLWQTPKPVYKVDGKSLKKLLKQRTASLNRMLVDAVMTDVFNCTVTFDESE